LEVAMGVDPRHRGITVPPRRGAVDGRKPRAGTVVSGLPGPQGAMDAGIARKIDDLGRVVIPAETRRLFNIREGDHILISVEGPNIVLRKMTSTCTFCGSEEHVTDFKGKGVCSTCRNQLLT